MKLLNLLIVIFFVLILFSCGDFGEKTNTENENSIDTLDEERVLKDEFEDVKSLTIAKTNPNALQTYLARVRSEAIVNTAIAEIGTDDDECDSPGCYYGNGGQWCSEFVSWVYWQAGYPFTGGDNGGWRLDRTSKIISYFSAKNAYVDRSNFFWKRVIDYIKPGDYVFIGRYNTDRRHSGIVEYVEKRTAYECLPDRCTIKTVYDLHTIEGNNSGAPVDRYVYPDFINNFTDNNPDNGIVKGIGLLDGFIQYKVAKRTK